MVVVFPAPLGPREPKDFAVFDAEVYVVNGCKVAVVDFG